VTPDDIVLRDAPALSHHERGAAVGADQRRSHEGAPAASRPSPFRRAIRRRSTWGRATDRCRCRATSGSRSRT
jgi:hypothetical protein